MKYDIYPKGMVRLPLKPAKTNFSLEELEHLFSSPIIQEALFLASPVLLEEYNKNPNLKDNSRLANSLLKYALRMHNRCTPFGLFSGCSVISLHADSQQVHETLHRKSRLDMDFVTELVRSIQNNDNLIYELVLQPNTTLYKFNDRLRYVEYQILHGRRLYQVTSINFNSVIKTILNLSKNGLAYIMLVNAVCEKHADLSHQDVKEFIKVLLDEQVLITNLEPTLTGKEYLTQVIEVLEGIPGNKYINNLLSDFKQINNQLSIIDKEPSSDNLNRFKQLISDLKKYSIKIDPGKIFQVDMFRNILGKNEDTSDLKFKKQLELAITILNRLSPKEKDNYLLDFKHKFYKRYENQEVALTEALDNESGIGYGRNPTTEKEHAQLKGYQGISSKNQVTWDYRNSFLFNKLLDARDNHQQSITISLNELSKFPEDWNDLPSTMSVNFRHIGKCGGEDIIQIKGVLGATALSILGRFGTGNDDVLELCENIAEIESNLSGDSILAEILHLPESRTGNVLLRPVLRKYEIPYLSRSSVSPSYQIPIEDLMISIKNGQLVLKSKKLNKTVIPRLGNAHNYSSTVLPIYHFLCDMQTNEMRRGLVFDWGDSQKMLKYFPRVQVGQNIILSPASWKLYSEDIQDWFIARNDKELLKYFTNWRSLNNQMPTIVLLAEGDNELIIDFGSVLSLRGLLQAVKNMPYFIISEYLYNPNSPLFKDSDNNAFTNEIIAVIYKNENSKNSQIVTSNFKKNQYLKVARTFSTGSEWLYFKIYCGSEVSDDLLANKLIPLMSKFFKAGIVSKWFFVRFSDPDNHIRLRIQLPKTSLLGDVILHLYNLVHVLEKRGVIWKIQTDSYMRELERYGFNSIMYTETLFFKDSILIGKLLKHFNDDKEKLFSSCQIIDRTLGNFNISLEAKGNILELLKIAFHQEFRVEKNEKIILDRYYRNLKTELFDYFSNSNTYPKMQKLISNHFSSNKQDYFAIESMVQHGQLEVGFNDYIISIIHMSINRIYSSDQRKHELSIYDLMSKFYKSKLAIEKNKGFD